MKFKPIGFPITFHIYISFDNVYILQLYLVELLLGEWGELNAANPRKLNTNQYKFQPQKRLYKNLGKEPRNTPYPI